MDLLTGKLAWNKQRQADSLQYVGCILDDLVTVIGQSDVVAYKLADGKEAWKLPLGDGLGKTAVPEQPTGRGLLSGSNYQLPTTARLAGDRRADGSHHPNRRLWSR